MIFGSVCDWRSQEDIKKMSVVIENLGCDFFSVNFCLNMDLFPYHLAYNLRSVLLESFANEEIFNNQVCCNFFNLNDRELMIELIKESFVYIYRREEIIKLGILPEEYGDLWIEKYDLLFDEVQGREENRDKLWEIDSVEYTDRGYFIFILNYLKRTKIIFIQQRNDLDDELGRFFDSEKNRKHVKFFDEAIWSVRVVEMDTVEILELNRQIVDYLSAIDGYRLG